MRVVDRVSAVLSGLGFSGSECGTLVVMYHGLGGEDGVDPGRFRDQLDRLCDARRVIPLAEAIGLLGTPEASDTAAVTFDDGYVDFAEHALPALADRGLHATLFVPAGHVGSYNRWDEGRAPKRAILGPAALCELETAHVEVGAHGMTHCRLRGLGERGLRREIRDARAVLEEHCRRPVRLFAYPYGQLDDFDAVAERAVEDAGFVAACSTRFGRGSQPRERFRLRRVGVGPADDEATFERKLEGAYDWVAYKEALGFGLRRARGLKARGV